MGKSKRELEEIAYRKSMKRNIAFYKEILGKTLVNKIIKENKELTKNDAILKYVSELVQKQEEKVYENITFRHGQDQSKSNFIEERIKVLGNTEGNFYKAVQQVSKSLKSEGKKPYMLKVVFKDYTTGQIRWRSISLENPMNEKELMSIIQSYEEEVSEGSDAVNNTVEEGFEWNPEYFDLVYMNPHEGYGRKKKSECLFKHEDLGDYKFGDCGRICLEKSGHFLTQKRYKELELHNLDNMKAYIDSHRLPIKIVANYVEASVWIICTKRIDGILVKKLEYENVTNLTIYDPGCQPEFYIIYDPHSKHYDVNETLELDNIYCSSGHMFYKLEDGKLKQLYKSQSDRMKRGDLVYGTRKEITRYLFFDIETATDYEERLINTPYSISFLDLNEDDINKLVVIEDTKNTHELQQFIKEKSHFYHGADCIRRFVDYIQEHDSACTYQLVSFNGVNFDNYILYWTCIHYFCDNIGDPLIANGQLLNFKLFNKHYPKDIRKFVSGSLKANCKAYNISLCAKKDGFSHIEMQAKYNDGVLWEFIKDNKKLEEYNTYDVLALAVLYGKFTKAISIALPTSNFNKSLTLGQLVNEVIEEDTKNQGIKMTKFISKSDSDLNERLFKYYKDCSRSRVAGRVQLFNGPQIINESIQSFDVCSLYPYVMAVAPVYYPCGDITEIDSFEELPKDKIGFFYCDIDQSNMSVTMIPNKTKIGNDWEAKIITNSFESSVMIKYLRKCGANVVTRNGIYFTEKIKSSDYFRILLDVMKYKNDQDTNKKNKTNYNPALRETYKLVLNIMSGKLNQGIVTEKRKIVNSLEWELLMESNKVQKLNTMYVLPNGKAHITYEVPEISLMGRCRNIFMGSLIYVYARIYMHKFIYSKIPREHLIYTDTDSLKTKRAFGEQWKLIASKIKVPHWSEVLRYDERYATLKMYQEDDKIFGSFEDEYKDPQEPNTMSIFIAKKCYLTYDKQTNYSRIHFKGVSENDKVIPTDQDVSKLTPRELCDMYNDPKAISIKQDPLKFFMDLYKNNKNRIITFSMKKINKNSKRNADMADISRHQTLYLQVCSNYGIKNLTY